MENFNIANERITASSVKSMATPAIAARWNSQPGNGVDGAWCARNDDQVRVLIVSTSNCIE